MLMKSRLALSILGVVCSLALGFSGCRKSPPPQSEAPTAPAVDAETSAPIQPQVTATEPSPTAQPDTVASDTQTDSASPPPPQINATPLSAQPARLTSRDPDAQINVRSQPTTKSNAPSYGLPDDRVTLLKKAQGDDEYSWYYVQFEGSNIEGWIREDFIDASGAVTASRQTPQAAPTAATPEPACGAGDQLAFFETENYTIDICSREGGMRYIGAEKGTDNSIVIDDVEGLENSFVAIRGDTEYIINSEALMVYQMNNGEYVQLSEESVIKAERF